MVLVLLSSVGKQVPGNTHNKLVKQEDNFLLYAIKNLFTPNTECVNQQLRFERKR